MMTYYHPEPLHDAFVVLGTSAAALIGLLFVAVSLHLEEVIRTETVHRRAHNNTCYLLIILIEALLMLVPQPLAVLGAEIVALNAVGFAILWRFVSAFFFRREQYRQAGGQPYIAGIFVACFLLGIAGGLALMFERDWGAFLVLASSTVLLARVVLTAWRILVGIGKLQ
jgi:modulator of FtsH protease